MLIRVNVVIMDCIQPGRRVIKLFIMLSSTENEIYHAP